MAAEVADEVIKSRSEGDQDLALRIKTACAAISKQMRDIRDVLTDELKAAGIAADALKGPEDRDALQYHLTTISLPSGNIGKAVSIAERFGFNLPFRATDNQFRAMAMYLDHVVLVREDAETTRVKIILSGKGNALPKSVRPTIADIATASPWLPASLYPFARIGRVARDRISGKRHALSDSDFIGTPKDLIAPILGNMNPDQNDVVFDLGCGDARVLLVAASQFQCAAVGVESNSELVSLARQNIAMSSPEVQSRIEILKGYAEDTDLSRASIVFLFLPGFLFVQIFRDVMNRVRPGTKIVAHEQAQLHGIEAPDQTLPVVGAAAMTVVNIWTKK